MKQTVTERTFKDAFKAIRPNNFSWAGLGAMWNYFEQYEADCGEEKELDVIAICCDWAEYDSAADACKEMITGWDAPEREEGESDDDYCDRVQESALEELRDKT